MKTKGGSPGYGGKPTSLTELTQKEINGGVKLGLRARVEPGNWQRVWVVLCFVTKQKKREAKERSKKETERGRRKERRAKR